MKQKRKKHSNDLSCFRSRSSVVSVLIFVLFCFKCKNVEYDGEVFETITKGRRNIVSQKQGLRQLKKELVTGVAWDFWRLKTMIQSE